MTKKSSVTFTVKETGDGSAWILLESRRETDAGFPAGMFGFRLPAGTPYEKAQEVARFMRDNLGEFTWTE